MASGAWPSRAAISSAAFPLRAQLPRFRSPIAAVDRFSHAASSLASRRLPGRQSAKFASGCASDEIKRSPCSCGDGGNAREARGRRARRGGGRRLRAERRWGELYRQSEKAKDGRPTQTCREDRQVSSLSDMGVSDKQSSRWQAPADIPEDESERGLRRKDPQNCVPCSLILTQLSKHEHV
jgi:hypothetical protein